MGSGRLEAPHSAGALLALFAWPRVGVKGGASQSVSLADTSWTAATRAIVMTAPPPRRSNSTRSYSPNAPPPAAKAFARQRRALTRSGHDARALRVGDPVSSTGVVPTAHQLEGGEPSHCHRRASEPDSMSVGPSSPETAPHVSPRVSMERCRPSCVERCPAVNVQGREGSSWDGRSGSCP
jgi:hypothetical protein